MDGATYLWNTFDEHFDAYAKGTLDFYHATQHLAALADALFAGDKDPEPRKEWLDKQCRKLKALGPKNLLETIEGIDWKSIRKREAKKTARREAAYFQTHKEHMDYDRNAALGVPIGSGAMESRCSQNQLAHESTFAGRASRSDGGDLCRRKNDDSNVKSRR